MAICCDAEVLAEHLANVCHGNFVSDVEHTGEGHAFTVTNNDGEFRVLVTSDRNRIDTKD